MDRVGTLRDISRILNNTVIYPDEAFIIAKKTPGDVTFEFEGQIETTDKKLLLPESGNQILAKNPYGADLMITELIPTSAITLLMEMLHYSVL